MARGRHPTRIHIAPPSAEESEKYLWYWASRDLHRETRRFPSLTSSDLFGNNRPVEIDFGCGAGNLICSRAREHSATNFLGIDLSQKPLFCAVRDTVDRNLENVRFIRGDFNVMLPLLRPETLNVGYYLFPNPPQDYHKARANMRRLEFFRSVHAALVPGGFFLFATDSPLFFSCVVEILQDTLPFEIFDSELDDKFVTQYRRVWAKRGRKVKSLVVRK